MTGLSRKPGGLQFLNGLQRTVPALLLVTSFAAFWLGVFGIVGARNLNGYHDQSLFLASQIAWTNLACGAALIAGLLRFRIAKAMATLVLVLLLGTLLACYGIETLATRSWLGLEIIGLLLCLVGAVCAWPYGNGPQGDYQWPDRFSIFIAASGCLFSVAGSYWLINQQADELERSIQKKVSEVSQTLQDTLYESIWGFQRISERWSSLAAMPSTSYRDMEFVTYLRDTSHALVVATVDESLDPTHVRFKQQISYQDLVSLLTHPEVQNVFQKDMVSDVAKLVEVEWPSPGDRVGLIATSWEAGSGEGGILVTVIDLPRIFEKALVIRQVDCCIQIDSGHRNVYQAGHGSPETAYYHASMPFNVAGQTFDVTLWIDPRNQGWAWDRLAWFFMLLGLSFTFFLNNSQRLAFIANRRAEEIQYRALYDPVTDLPNRQMYEQFVKQYRDDSSLPDLQVWVVFIALIGIRLINDSMGHGVGDKVLRTVGKRLSQVVGGGALVSRIDSGNFAICVSGLTSEQVDAMAAELISVISEPLAIDPHLLRIRSVAGIAGSPARQADPETLLSQADLAMLRARKEGLNSWYYFTNELAEQASQQLSLHADLQGALRSHQMSLNYQPIIDGQTGEIVGFEALMRWHHPKFGFVPPSKFIAMAEESGQIVELTQWALEKAAKAAIEFSQALSRNIPVAVNISVEFFKRSDFIHRIRSVLAKHRVSSSCLEIEITESLLLEDADGALVKLKELDKLGVKIALDDFGTGYSGLNYLKVLPIHKVKLDRSFVSDILENAADVAIARAVVAVASLMQLTVTVEGVETETQFLFLKQMRCNHYQGYLFAKPMPQREVVRLLQSTKGMFKMPGIFPDVHGGRSGVLVIGDEEILDELIECLQQNDVSVYKANDVTQATVILANQPIMAIFACADGALIQQVIELYSGVSFLYPGVSRILLTRTSGLTLDNSIEQALQDRIVSEVWQSPLSTEDLQRQVESVLYTPAGV